MVVALVHLEVVVEVVDAFREDSDLYFWRTGIRCMVTVCFNGFGLIRHSGIALFSLMTPVSSP